MNKSLSKKLRFVDNENEDPKIKEIDLEDSCQENYGESDLKEIPCDL